MKLNRAFIAAAALVVALVGAALAGVVAHATADKPASKTTTITVKETEYHLALSSRKSVIGPARFVIKNNGKIAHAFAIAGPGLKTKKTKAIKPGASAILLVTLGSGTYTVWCPMPRHAGLGMKSTVTVRGAVTGGGYGGAGTTTPATTTDGGAAWG